MLPQYQYTVVDTIQGTFEFMEGGINWEEFFCMMKQARRKLSYYVVQFFSPLVIIEIYFDLYLSSGSEFLRHKLSVTTEII